MNLIGSTKDRNRRLRQPHVVVFPLIVLLWLTAPVPAANDWASQISAWLALPATVASADAIVVLGGSASTRLPAAVALYQAGLAPEFWYTGTVEDSREGDGTSAQLAVKRAQEMGVPAAAITLLVTSSTWEDGQQIAATARARGVKSVLLITDWYHGRRALCAIHHHLQGDGVQVYYQPVEPRGVGPDDWWLSAAGQRTVLRELYKNLYYWGVYGLVPWKC